MTSDDCEEADLDIIRDILGNRSEQILSEDVTRIDKETFRELFLNNSEQGIISDDLISELFSSSNTSQNCSNPYILRMGDSRPLSEEVISWVLATLPMGAMVRIIRMTLSSRHLLFQIGSLLSVVLLKLLGRKLTIIISGVLFLVSFLCIGLSSLAGSHVMLLVFRVMSGCAVGIAVPSVR